MVPKDAGPNERAGSYIAHSLLEWGIAKGRGRMKGEEGEGTLFRRPNPSAMTSDDSALTSGVLWTKG